MARRLRDLAHCRTGDKGDVSDVSVIAFDPADFPLLERVVTAGRVKAHFGAIVQGDVARHVLPGIAAMNFVMDGALGGGVTRSLALDAHGKGLASLLLEMEIPDTDIDADPAVDTGGTAP